MIYYMGSFEHQKLDHTMAVCVQFEAPPRLRDLLSELRSALGSLGSVEGMSLVDFWEASPEQVDRWWQEGAVDRPASTPYEPIAA